jgi:hypothetical protein
MNSGELCGQADSQRHSHLFENLSGPEGVFLKAANVKSHQHNLALQNAKHHHCHNLTWGLTE